MLLKKETRCFWYSVCPIKRFTDEGKLEEKWVKQYCLGDSSDCVRKKMEEEGKYHPDNMLPNGEIRKDLK
ncbi:MAG: uracil-DNA glycosylase [Candidatus Helarchaeota archaeon]